MTGRTELSELRIDAYPTRREWLDSRAANDNLGASEASMALGVSPYGTPWTLWESKMRPAKEKRADQLQRGHRWEPSVLAEYEDESGHEVLTPAEACQVPPGSIVVVSNPRLPWLRQSPDGFAIARGELGQVEAKTAVRAHVWAPEPGLVIDRWDDTYAEIVPPHYAVQGYVQLIVSVLPWVDLCALVPRGMWLGVRWVRLMRDAETQQQIEDALTEWRDRHLVHGEPPPIDGGEACNRYLARAFPPRKKKPARIATPEEADKMVRLAGLRAEIDAAKEEADRLRNELLLSAEGYRLHMPGEPKGPYGQPQATGGRVTLNVARMRRELPDVVKKYEQQGERGASFNLYRFKK